MSTTTTQTNEPASEATADEATILARVDEALAVFPLPKPRTVRAQAKRTLGDSLSPELRARLAPLPPALHLYWRTGREMREWAAHLSIPLQVRVATYDDGDICRTVNAHGTWLGWSVWLAADEEQYRNITPAPVAAIVRRAHLGVL